jgi:hypothetical protein
MKNLWIVMMLGGLMSVASMPNNAEDWIPIDNGEELTQMLSGVTLEHPDYVDYYRSDGVMAYYNKLSNSIAVRKWMVDENGKVCAYIYVVPDKLVDCYVFSKSASEPGLVRMTNPERGDSYKVRITDATVPKVIDAINEVAGPEN